MIILHWTILFGGFLGMGDKLFAIPWSALALDTVEKRFILNVDKELLKRAPTMKKSDVVIVNVSGRGDKDIGILKEQLGTLLTSQP